MLYKFEKQEYKVVSYKDYCEFDPMVETQSFDNPFFFNIEKIRKSNHEYEYLETKYGEELFVKNYGNLLTDCSFAHLKMTVSKNDEKVKLVTKLFSKSRIKGARPFNKETKIFYLTFDLKHNNLYFGVITDQHKKNKKYYQCYKNNWYTNPLKRFLELTKSYLKLFRKDNFEIMEQDGFELAKCIDLFLENIPSECNPKLNKEEQLYHKFLNLNKIKLPNNWNKFTRLYPQVTKKLYKKNKYKFVDAYMELHNLKGDKIKRVLHTIESTHGIHLLKFGIYLFGEDLILSQSDEFIKSVIESGANPQYDGTFNIATHIQQLNLNDFTKTEKKYAFEIFKLILNRKINFNSFIDHIQYKERLKLFDPKLWKSKNYFEFMNEHYEWSELIKSYKSSEYTRHYNDKFKLVIEEPIDDYYPILLTTTKEYNFESIMQSNCVRTYDEKPESVIISVRHKDINSEDRATIEYKIIDDHNSISLIRVQSLGKFNKLLDNEWKPILEILDTRIKFCTENVIFQLPNVDIKYKNNIISTKVVFKEVGEIPITYPNQRNPIMLKRLMFENNIDREEQKETRIINLYDVNIPF
jgi:hypothetical protein